MFLNSFPNNICNPKLFIGSESLKVSRVAGLPLHLGKGSYGQGVSLLAVVGVTSTMGHLFPDSNNLVIINCSYEACVIFQHLALVPNNG